MKTGIENDALFDFSHTVAGDFLQKLTYPHEALPLIGEWILTIGEGLDAALYDHPAKDIWIAKSAKVLRWIERKATNITKSACHLSFKHSSM